MIKRILWSLLFILAAALLQSTVLSPLTLHIHAIPDLALLILVFFSYMNGTMMGQISGFISGILLDFLSPAPLGLNSFIRTLIGAITGLFKGTFYLDIIFLPMILCAIATLFKALIFYLLHLLFGDSIPSYAFFELKFWVELGLNTILAPFVFGILKIASSLIVGQGDKS